MYQRRESLAGAKVNLHLDAENLMEQGAKIEADEKALGERIH